MNSPPVELDIEGLAAPPRVNGELVFEAPWEGRAFGMVMTLCAQEVIEWEQFRAGLMAEIKRWESAPYPKAEWSYYACWLAALESVLAKSRLLQATEIDTLFQVFVERPHGHDHHQGMPNERRPGS